MQAMSDVAPLLVVSGVTVRCGGSYALENADFVIPHGSISALIGPRGAGKTTMLGTISGVVPVETGSILLDGQDITHLPSYRRSAIGVARIFRNLEVLTAMTVLENVMIGRHSLNRYFSLASLLRIPAFRRAERVCRQRAMEKLDFVGLADVSDLLAGELPPGRQRLLELARALITEPKLLLLDEPTAGLDGREIAALGRCLCAIRDTFPLSVGLVERDLDLVRAVSDRVTVFAAGHPLAAGTPDAILADPDVRAIF